MADVFISYKRDERSAVEEIAARLRALGLQVWFDGGLSAGESFNDEIDREARAAKLILVCWSPTARESKWVKSEAMIGFEHDKLAAALVAGPDGFSPPAPFNTVHAEDLRAWIAAPNDAHAGWKSVLRRIGKMCARPDIESYGALDAQAGAAELRAWIAAHEQSPLFMAVDAMLHAREAQDAEWGRLEQEARARRAREEAERRAREEAERKLREAREAEARALWEVERRREQEAERARAADRELRQRQRERQRRTLAPGLAGWIATGATVLVLFLALSSAGVFRGTPERDMPQDAAQDIAPAVSAEAAGEVAGTSVMARCSYAIVRVVAPEGPVGMTLATATLANAPHVTAATPLTAQHAATLLGVKSSTLPDPQLIEIELSSERASGDVGDDIQAALAQAGVTAEITTAIGCR